MVITALSNPEKKELIDCDFVSRFFGPNIGIAEDPVTGSAHCGLAPFLEIFFPSSMGWKISARVPKERERRVGLMQNSGG